MQRRTLSLSILLATSMLACSESPGKTEAPVTIAYITTNGECNPFFAPCSIGAEQAKADLTSASGRPVDVLIMTPECIKNPTDAGTPAEDAGAPDPCFLARSKMALLREAIDKHVNAIVLDVPLPHCTTDLINEAVDAGIKVITYNGDAADSKRHTYYGLDNKAAGAFLMDALATLNGKTGRIVFQTATDPDGNGGFVNSKSDLYVNRAAGFHEALAKYPNMTDGGLIPCLGSDNNDPFCAMQVEQALSAHPELVGFFFARGKLLREANLATNAPLLTARVKAKTIHSVAFDALPESFDAIRAGYAEVVLAQKVFAWGYDTVLLAYDMVTIGRQVTPFTDSGWYTICPNNIDEFAKNFMAQDYRTPLSKCTLLH